MVAKKDGNPSGLSIMKMLWGVPPGQASRPIQVAPDGRFLSVDPGKDWDPAQPQSWNMYSYVRNNPVNRVDPDGRNLQDVLDVIKNRLTNAQQHFRRANDAMKKVPVVKVTAGGKVAGMKFQAGPATAEARVDVRAGAMKNNQIPVSVRGAVTGGVAGSPLQGAARLNVSGDVGRVQRWATVSNVSATPEAVFGTDRNATELSNAIKSSGTQLMWTGSAFSVSVDIGVDFGQAARVVGELGEAASAIVTSGTQIKDPEQ